MKKLMMVIGAVAMSLSLSAATVSWSASGVSEYGKTSAAPASLGYYSVLVNADVVSKNTMIAALEGGDFSLLADGVISGSEGAFNTSVAGFVSAKNAGNFGNSETINAYALIFDGSLSDAKHVFATDVLTKTTGANGQAANFGFGSIATATGNTANWAEIAPEPTSGLMMLLGMGVLALRRRRA